MNKPKSLLRRTFHRINFFILNGFVCCCANKKFYQNSTIKLKQILKGLKADYFSWFVVFLTNLYANVPEIGFKCVGLLYFCRTILTKSIFNDNYG